MARKLLLIGFALAHVACVATPKKTSDATSKRVDVTGSHIPRADNTNLEAKSVSPMRVYGERDLESTGRATTGEQIGKVDVSSTGQPKSGASAPK